MAQIILDSNNNLIQGDFDNATLNNRTKLQTTTTNATTNVYVVPNGSSTSAGVSVANNSSLTNASKIVMATNGTTDTQIISGVNGSGTYLPLSFYTNNALAAQISTAGVLSFNSGYGSAAVAYGCRAWVTYDGSTGAVTSSGNVSSVTKNGPGDWSINFTNALVDGNYAIAGFVKPTAAQSNYTYSRTVQGRHDTAPTTTFCRVSTVTSSIGQEDNETTRVIFIR